MNIKYGMYAGVLLVCVLSQSKVVAEKNTTDPEAKRFSSSEHSDAHNSEPQEEMLIMGSRREGDYTFITEDAQKLVETAGAFGDPLAAVFALPGVVYSSGEGSEPAVRGSSPSDNQYVVDFLPASYIFHEFGVSVFSEYILHDFQMYSAGVGAEYSDVTGAVFDVTLRKPENKSLGGVVDMSMLRSGVFLEGGVTDHSAFYLSYRKSLIHLFINEEDASDEDEGIVLQKIPQDDDYQFKYVWDVTEQSRVSVSASGASDEAAAEFTAESELARSNPDFQGDAHFIEKYRGKSVLWETFGTNGSEFKLGYGMLTDNADLRWGGDYRFDEQNKNNTLKMRYSKPLHSTFAVAIGAQQTDTEYSYVFDMPLFICTEFDSDCDSRRRENIQAADTIDWVNKSYYLSGTWAPIKPLNIELGVQQQTNDLTDETFNHPRLAISMDANDTTTFTVKAGRYNQLSELSHVLSDTGNPDLKSPESNHYVLGVQKELGNEWNLSVETYYKTFEQLPLAIAESEPDGNLRYANDTEGSAHGIDVMLNKNLTDDWYGWLSFSYGKSERKNLRIQETREYHLDTPLIVNWVMNWQAKPKFNVGWRWSIRSGSAYTPIVGVQDNPYFEDSVLPVYGEEFTDRLPMYNRLDIRFKWDSSLFGNDSEIILDIINALNNKNVEDRVMDYGQGLMPGDAPRTKDIVGIGLQPALTYRVSF